jgi:RHS repeat-associated core domain
MIAQMNTDGTLSSTYLYSVMYYDNRGRLIQTKSNNHLAGGIQKEYIAYNFTGQPTKRMHVHSATGKTTQTEIYTYEYDHAGRLLKTKHKLNTGAEIVLAQNTYDELGRLKTNQKHTHANLKTTYAYNIRSWTKSITSPLFSQTLYYNDKVTAHTYSDYKQQYNGNISGMEWQLQGESKRSYRFKYDKLSRLLHTGYNGSTSGGMYNVSYSYDKHGNMKTLTRRGKNSSATDNNVTIDQLTMTYAGNQLTRVEDAAADISYALSDDFKDKKTTTGTIEYTYNKNGAMASDLNKGITDIEYNSLNLPRQMIINSSTTKAKNYYTYSASGVKLKTEQRYDPTLQQTPVGNTTPLNDGLTNYKNTDYVGNIIYESTKIGSNITDKTRILIDGGYIEGGVYYFYLTDHLGNNRVVAKADGTVIQKNHYYPFGMAFAEGAVSEQGKQPYKYNGKKLDPMHGLNMYDYSARYYESAIGRFTSVDPLAEKYYSISPYVYVANNPINAVDPDGKKIIPVNVTRRDGRGQPVGESGLSRKTNAAMTDIMKTSEGRAFFGQFAEKGQTLGGYTFTENGKYSDTNLTIYDYSWSKETGNVIPSGAEGSLNVSEGKNGKMSATLKVSSLGMNQHEIGEVVTHETQLHGYKSGDKIDGKKVVGQDVDHSALKNKDTKHKGCRNYNSVRQQLEKIDENYKATFKEAEEHAKRNY